MSTTATLTGTITVVDSSSGSQPFQKQLVNLFFTGNVSEIANSFVVGSSPTSVSLPVSPCQFVYIKNLAPSATVTITWTPNGGASNPVSTLEPGGAIVLVNTASGAGITALSLQASLASTPVEYVLLG